MSANFESNLICKLAEIEKNFAVDKICYNGVYIWPLIKIKIYFEIWQKYNVNNQEYAIPAIYKKIFSFIKNGFLLVFKDFLKNNFSLNAYALIFADPFNRRISIDNKKYEIYSDPIYDKLQSLNYKTLVVERNSASRYPSPRYSASLPQILLFPFFISNLFRKIILDKESQEILDMISTDLKLKGYVVESINKKSIDKFLKIYNVHLNMYLFLIKLSKAKIVFLTEWYSIASIACITACKKLGVRSVELQHGVQTESHIAYGNWNAIPKNKIITPFPNYFWVWSYEDKKNIDTVFTKYNSKSFLGGNLYISSVKNSQISFPEYKELAQLLIKTNLKICLLTLQPTYELNSKIREFLATHKNKYFFLIRLHPIMLNRKHEINLNLRESISDINFEIDLASRLPLILLLKSSSLHVTFNSSVVIEADAMNIPSIVLDTDMAPQYFKSHIDAGRCFVYSESLEIEKIFEIKNLDENQTENISQILI